MKLKTAKSPNVKRQRNKIALSFDKAISGVLGLSPEDAKAVRESASKKKK